MSYRRSISTSAKSHLQSSLSSRRTFEEGKYNMNNLSLLNTISYCILILYAYKDFLATLYPLYIPLGCILVSCARSAEPKWRSLGPVFFWITDRWALVLILGCILLGTPVLSSLWDLLVSEMQDRIFRAFLWCLLCVFLLSRTCVPTINNLSTLVEFVSNNFYHYCCCSIFKTLCRS